MNQPKKKKTVYTLVSPTHVCFDKNESDAPEAKQKMQENVKEQVSNSPLLSC